MCSLYTPAPPNYSVPMWLGNTTSHQYGRLGDRRRDEPPAQAVSGGASRIQDAVARLEAVETLSHATREDSRVAAPNAWQ